MSRTGRPRERKANRLAWNVACCSLRTMFPRLGLVAMLAFGGCLFVGDINQRPSVLLTLETQGDLDVGAAVMFSAEVHDDQPDPMLEVDVLDGSGAPADPC